MRFLLVILSTALLWTLSETLPILPGWPGFGPPKEESTLKLVHLLFRHGNRNLEQSALWKGNAYRDAKYYPEGFGQLTNAGKLTEYNLGKFLRTRYDSFLGDTWNINYADFRSSDYNRTKMSGLLVMAGLWPPKGDSVWTRELPWQPVPYNYAPINNDPLLFPLYCPTYGPAFDAALNSPEIQSYLTERYGDVMQILNENIGTDLNNFYGATGYYDVMKVQQELGYSLDKWTSQVYPEPLRSLTVDMYYIWTNTTTLRQILAGTFIKKVLEDSQSAADGTLSPLKKLFVYSAHDLNVGSAILSLDAFKMRQPPPYGATLIVEVHKIRGVWGLKLFYIDYTEGSPHPLTIPGCAQFCPIDQFYSLVEEILPTTDVCRGT